MIDKKELRVGNLLMHGDQIVTVEEIGSSGINELWVQDRLHWNYDYGNLSPISITEEWIHKCEFYIASNDGYYTRISNGIIEVKISKSSMYPRVRIGEIHFTNILFVHQLQNIYYLLTGVELTIKQ